MNALKNTAIATALMTLAGCQTISQKDTPNLYQVHQLVTEKAQQTCTVSGGGGKTTHATISNLRQATLNPNVISGTITSSKTQRMGTFIVDISTGRAQCGNFGELKPSGLENTGWVTLTDEASYKLLPNAIAVERPIITKKPDLFTATKPQTTSQNSTTTLSSVWRVLETCKVGNGDTRTFKGRATLTTPYNKGASKIYDVKYTADYGDVWTGTATDKNGRLIIELDPMSYNKEKVSFLYDGHVSDDGNKITGSRGANCEMTALRQ